MAENVYGCVYFNSDKTVSVIPRSRCTLRDAFDVRGEVEVKWRVRGKQQTYIGTILQVSTKQDKHLLDRYSEDLHLFITTFLKETRDFSVDDLISRWQPDNYFPFQNNEASQTPPPKKQRVENIGTIKKHKTGTEMCRNAPSTKSKAKSKQTEKKRLESSQSFAAKEIIASTQFSGVFPSQQGEPVSTMQQQNEQQQIKAQRKIKLHQAKPPKAKRHEEEQWPVSPVHNETDPGLRSTPFMPTGTTNTSSQEQPNQRYIKKPLSLEVLREMGSGSGNINPVRIDSERLPLASTGNVVRKALTMLDEFGEDTEDLICLSSSPGPDDSGIFGESDFDSSEPTEQEDLHDKVSKLEKENEALKQQLNASRFVVPPPEVIEYLKKLIGHMDGADELQLRPQGPSPSHHNATTSYALKANFKPAEGNVRLLKGYDVFVAGIKLRQIISDARSKGPIHLLLKLIPLVFSDEELANSCGQGLGNSQIKMNGDDCKDPLDPIKTQVLKDYMLSFCVANDKVCPVAKQINEAFTQKVSYARRKRQRLQGKLETFC